MTETERMNAYIWASKLHPDAVPLLDLRRGERFKHYGGEHHTIYTYLGRGWYRKEGRPRCFRTGVKTAVVRVEDKQ